MLEALLRITFMPLLLCSIFGCSSNQSSQSNVIKKDVSSETKGVENPVLKGLTIKSPKWVPLQKNENMAIWSDSDGDVLGVNYFSQKRDIPVLKNGPQEIRTFFRDIAQNSGSGLVEADVVKVQGLYCGRLIIKAPQEGGGVSYQGTCVIPRKDFSYSVRVQCMERGMTGLRDATVLLIEEKNGNVVKGTFNGWRKDPYDKRFDSKALYNLSDQKKYDKDFPNHPLARVRNKLDAIINSIILDEKILNSAEN